MNSTQVKQILSTVLLYCISIIYAQDECTPGPLCPSNVASEISSCTVTDDGTRSTIWSGNSSVFDCENNRITLSHGAPNDVGHCSAATARLAPPNGNSYTSTLSVTPSSEMDGAIIQCYYPTINGLIQECVLNITDPPGHPQCASANIETVTTNDPIDSVLVTLNWIEPLSEGDITGYSIIITPPLTIYPTECLEGSTSPCNVSSSVTSLQFHFNSSTPYTISVSAMNCDSQLGEPSVFDVNNLEVPMAGVVRETVVVSLEYENQSLKNISLSWDPVESSGGNITGCGNTLAKINDTSYSIVQLIDNTEEISLANNIPCCNYSYSLNDTYATYNITLRAANDVGVGQEALSIFINSTKYCFDLNHTLSLSNQEVQPQISTVSFNCSTCDSMKPESLNCTITYGTDQDNLTMNYTAGIQDRVTEYTEYFFKAVVNFENNTDVTVRGNFTTCGDPPPAPSNCERDYKGFGLTVTYTCSGIYELVGNSTRTCTLENGWGENDPTSKFATWFIVVIIVIIVLVIMLLIILIIIFVICIRKKFQKGSQTHHKDNHIELKNGHKGTDDQGSSKMHMMEKVDQATPSGGFQARTQSQSRGNTQPPPQTKPPLPPSGQQQQQHPAGLIYADLEISKKKPAGTPQEQHRQILETSMGPGEVTYSAVQDQQTAP